MPIPLGILAVAGAGGAAAGAFDLLETTLVSTNTASVTFSNLNTYSDYKHLQIRTALKTNAGTTGIEDLRLTFNSDSGSNYAWHRIRGDGSTVASTAGTSTAFINIENSATRNNETNIYAGTVLDILDFSNSSNNTTTRSLQGVSASVGRILLASGLWNNTAAVTSITFTPAAGSLVAGSRFSLYGVK